MRVAWGLSWIGAAFAACGAAAGGLEVHAEAAERAKPAAVPEPTPLLPRTNPSPVTVSKPEPVPLAVSPDDPAASLHASAALVATDTRMTEEQAAVHLAEAFRAVLGQLPSHAALSLLWAHWAHETGRGRRMYGFNFGGLKGRGPKGTGFLTWTREAAGEGRSLVQRTFRTYPNAEAGARDYLELLSGRFPSALRAAHAGNVALFVGALSTRGYFTDDEQAYTRGIASLNFECRRRGLAESALLRLASIEGTSK